MPLPLTVSCSSKIQIGFTFLVPAYPGCPGKEAVKWLLLLLLFLPILSSVKIICWWFWFIVHKTKGVDGIFCFSYLQSMTAFTFVARWTRSWYSVKSNGATFVDSIRTLTTEPWVNCLVTCGQNSARMRSVSTFTAPIRYLFDIFWFDILCTYCNTTLMGSRVWAVKTDSNRLVHSAASPWVSWSMGSLGSLVRSSSLVLLGDQPHSPCMVHGVEGSHDAPSPCRGTCSARDPDLIQTQNRIQSMWAEHKWSGNWSRACQNCYWSYLFSFY